MAKPQQLRVVRQPSSGIVGHQITVGASHVVLLRALSSLAWCDDGSSLFVRQTRYRISTVRLLPNFDPYTVAVRDHRQYLGEYKDRVYRQAGWISPVVLVNGRIEGVWKYEKARAGLAVTVEMFERHHTSIGEQIEAEAERIGDFLGSGVETSFGPM